MDIPENINGKADVYGNKRSLFKICCHFKYNGHQDRKWNNTYTMCKIRKRKMETKDKIKKLRESTGMNRKEFCEYFEIPYRTVTEWERGTRKMPDYILRLLAYRVKMDNLIVKEDVNEE